VANEGRVHVWVNVLTESLGGSSTFQGDHHTLFLYDNGQVWAVGSNLDNQLGLADDNPAKADKVYDPVQVRITGRIAVLKRRADSASRPTPGHLPASS
jgi:alpha-tubulin suppressor-like RCC1 family protein